MCLIVFPFFWVVGYCRVVCYDTHSITHIITFINIIKSYSCYRMDCGTIAELSSVYVTGPTPAMLAVAKSGR